MRHEVVERDTSVDPPKLICRCGYTVRNAARMEAHCKTWSERDGDGPLISTVRETFRPC